jgi:lipopolysaccharide export system protein LptA
MKPFTATAAALLAAFAIASAALGAPQGAGSADPASGASGVAGFDHIATKHISFNYDNGNFTLPGPFTASSKDTDITADQATGNSKQKLLHAHGHVVVHKKAEQRPGGNGSTVTQKPSTLTCDSLDADGISKVYTCNGNMHFMQEGGRDATSDTATLDDAHHHLHMQGNVHVQDKDRTINASTIDYDTISGQIEADGDVTITAPAETPPPGTPPISPIKHKKII